MWMYHFLNDGGQRIQRNMFHRIWAFSQEADDTRVVNHLKRPAPHRQPLLELAGLQRRCKYRSFSSWIYMAWLGSWDRANVIGGERHVASSGGGGCLSLGGWGWSLHLLGSSPRVPSEELPAGQTDPPLLLSVFLFQLKTVSNKWNVNMVLHG